MTYVAFIVIGALLTAMGFSQWWHSNSRVRKPKHLRTKTRKYFTNGHIIMVKVKKAFYDWANGKYDKDLRASPNHYDPEQPDKPR
jgi:hypothetical protein